MVRPASAAARGYHDLTQSPGRPEPTDMSKTDVVHSGEHYHQLARPACAPPRPLTTAAGPPAAPATPPRSLPPVHSVAAGASAKRLPPLAAQPPLPPKIAAPSDLANNKRLAAAAAAASPMSVSTRPASAGPMAPALPTGHTEAVERLAKDW